MPLWGPGDSAAAWRASYGPAEQDAQQQPPPPQQQQQQPRTRRRLLSFRRQRPPVQDTAASLAAQAFGTVRDSIYRIRRAGIIVCPAPTTVLQAIWFHPMTMGLLQMEGNTVSNRLKLAGLITAIVWYNPLTRRVVLLYNNDILTQYQDLEAIKTLTNALLPLATQGDLERQRQFQHPSASLRVGLLSRHVPAWGTIYTHGRGGVALLGHYPAEVLDGHLAEAYWRYAGPHAVAERATLPQMAIWREALHPQHREDVC